MIPEALHPAREPLEVLKEFKRSIGVYDFAGQYQQDPAPREGGLARAEHFPRQSSENVKFDMKIQSWDTAHKTGEMNDYPVCTTWGRTEDNRYFRLDVFRAKLAFPQLVARVRSLYAQYKSYNVLIEDGASGPGLIQALRREGRLPIKAIKPEGDKVTRLNILTGLIESGYVVLPRRRRGSTTSSWKSRAFRVPSTTIRLTASPRFSAICARLSGINSGDFKYKSGAADRQDPAIQDWG